MAEAAAATPIGHATPAAARPSLSLRDVACTFAGGYTAVRGVSLEVAEGEFVSVVGPSGCGKSTLLNMAAGLLAPSEGEVEAFGAPLRGLNLRAGYIFQADALMPWKTARDNVAVGLEARGLRRAEALARADDWLARVGLRAFGDRYPHQLSGGQRQRVAIARAMILEPMILLLDEPTSALDVSVQAEVLNLLTRLRREHGLTFVLVSHNLAVVAHMCDRLAVMNRGRIIEELTGEQLRAGEAREPYTRQLLVASRGYDRRAATELVDYA